MDTLNPDQRRRNMQAIKACETKSEVVLRKALWKKGYRYRKNDKTLIGKPDIVFRSLKIAIFIDGEFWHGKNWRQKKEKISKNREYWIKKIERNIARDKETQAILQLAGWTVMRFWHKEVIQQLQKCIEQVEIVILRKQDEYKVNIN